MTAEKLYGIHFNGLHYDDVTPEMIQKYAIVFAQYHVEQALKSAQEEVFVCSEGVQDIKDCIKSCYPKENIK